MKNESPIAPSRRKALAGFAATAACAFAGNFVAGSAALSGSAAETCTGPTFSPTGPDAELYGATEGYPVPEPVAARSRGNPWEPKYRVGAFSYLDQLYPTRSIERAANPWMFKCSGAEVHYEFRGSRFSLIDYVSRNPLTGFLIVKDDQILYERYQYAEPIMTGSCRSRWLSR